MCSGTLAHLFAVDIPNFVPAVPENGQALIVVVRLGAGLFAGFALGWVIRNQFSRWHGAHSLFRASAFTLEKLCVLSVGILTGVFELWKRTSFETNDRFLLTIYIVVGFLTALSISITFLTGMAKDEDKAKIKALEASAKQAIAQRDASLEAVSAISAVIEAKKERLKAVVCKPGVLPLTELSDSLGSKVQVITLIKSVHQQMVRQIPAPNGLRVGVYMRNPENLQQLAPLYSWNGKNEGCFKNSNPGYMSLDAPGGAQSLVVQCFRSENPLLTVSDCVKAQEQNKFVFFYPDQRVHLRSMVAYRYNLMHSGKPDALIITMDTDIPSFFAAERDFQCQLLLQETGRRLELELISLDLIKKLPLPPVAP